ncbi:MAG TPA: energy transducer TonB [Flavobacterium sp.]|nr:energy transducer TonB [Flavobacterium sp.]
MIPYKDIDVNTLSVFNGFLADKDYIYAKEYRILRNEKVEMLGVFRGYVPGCGIDETPSSTYYLFKNIDGHWIVLISGNNVKVRYIGLELDEKLKGDINFENIVYPVHTGEPETIAEVLPEYPEGLTKLNEFFKENFKIPNLERNIKGRVLLQFIVEKDGSLSDIKVIRDLGHGTGKEAVRLLKLAGKWSPGLQNGEPVRTSYTLPVPVDVEIKQE